MSFALVLLFVFVFLFLICRNKISKVINEGVWCFKISFIILFWVLSLFIRNSFFEVYLEITKYISIVYMVFQSIVFIDLFYIWGTNWIKKFEEGKKYMKCVLISTFIILYALVISKQLIIIFKIQNLNKKKLKRVYL
jgi:serine incorporator 1/3